jgi:NADH-quinone oxidoreductase subunit L
MLSQLLILLLLPPIIAFAICLFLPRNHERAIFSVAITAMFLELALFIVLGFLWLSSGVYPISAHAMSLYSSQHYSFSIDLYFDWVGAVYLGMAVLMTTLVLIFSKYYMHREEGFKRFYTTIFIFFMGLALITLAGNFEVLFLGWELIGISSLLLIAFYRDRFLPARNALKVFSVFRIADAFLLVAIWYAHHLFEVNIHFSDISQIVAHHGNQMALLGLFILLAAVIKSAQFPFSYWLPRAMEGPTTSSAIFYGALSVHMGLFIMLRTFPLWEGSVSLRIAVAAIGLTTAIISTSIARVQSSIKTQIAYASITQIGIMFIELAAGLQWLVLLHFVSNASLRTYQLLISPSAVSYLIHDQFFNFVPPTEKITNVFTGKIRATLYVLGIKEWNMNTGLSQSLWIPLKSIGRALSFLDKPIVQIICLAIFLANTIVAATVALSIQSMLAVSFAAAGLSIAFYVRAYSTKNSARICWNLIMLGHLFGALFLAVASSGAWKYFVMYGAGVVIAFIIGHICLWYLKTRGEPNVLRDYQGSIYVFTKLGHLFFIVCLLFMAFPLSPSFLAQDILLSSIPGSHVLQMLLYCLSYLLVGVSIMRLYIKVFFGPHKTSYHEIAYKSS